MNKGPTLGAIILIIISMLAVLAIMFFYVTYSINVAQHDWCQALQLLTSHKIPKPSNPSANPSRENAYRYYQVFVTLKERLGCSR